MSRPQSRFAAIQMLGTVLSRVSGMARLAVQGALLGSGRFNDIYTIAFLIPNLFRVVVAEEAIKNSFLPVYKHYRDLGDAQSVRRFSRAFAGALLAVIALVVGAGILFAPYYVPFIAGGFSPEEKAQTITSTRIIFPFLFFMGYAGFGMAVLYSRETSHGHWVTSLSPLAFNGGIIAAAFTGWLVGGDPLLWLSMGMVLGALLQWASQVPALLKETTDGGGQALLPSIDLSHPGLREVAVQWLPAIVGGSFVQLNVTIDRMIASYLAVGSITALAYAARLLQFPIGAVGVSTSVSLHATLSAAWKREDREAFDDHLGWGLRYALFFSLPITVYFIVCAEPICRALFEFGKFDAAGCHRAALALMCYSPGIVVYTSIRLLRTSFSALRDNAAFARIEVTTIIVNVALNLCYIGLFFLAGMRDVAFMGLAMGTSSAAVFQGYLLARSLKKAQRLGDSFGIRRLAGREGAMIFLAGGIMVVVGLLGNLAIGHLWVGHALWQRGLRLGVLSVVSWGAYLAACRMARVEALMEFEEKLLRKWKNSKSEGA